MLTASGPNELLFFQTCPRPTDGGVSLEHVLLDELGPSATFEGQFSSGEGRISITAPAGSALERCYHAYVRALVPRFEVELERLAPEDASPPAPLSIAQERLLLDALAIGYFDAPRLAGIRELAHAAGRGKSAHDDALREALAALSRKATLGAHAPREDMLVFEFWGGVARSAHYSTLLGSTAMSARADTIHVTRDRAWQVVVAEGLPVDLDRLQTEVERAPAPPIERLSVLSRVPTRLVFFDEWRRPVDSSQGLSMEHLLFDRAGSDAALQTEFRHGACRVTCVGPTDALEGFWLDVAPRLRERYRVERVLGAHDPHDALAAAQASGYLDLPRRGSLDDVARRLGVSATTASARVRFALREAILQHVPGAHARLHHEEWPVTRNPERPVAPSPGS